MLAGGVSEYYNGAGIQCWGRRCFPLFLFNLIRNTRTRTNKTYPIGHIECTSYVISFHAGLQIFEQSRVVSLLKS